MLNIFSVDKLRKQVENISSGKQTVIYDDFNDPNIMTIVPKMKYSDCFPCGSDTTCWYSSSYSNVVHPAFQVFEEDHSITEIDYFMVESYPCNYANGHLGFVHGDGTNIAPSIVNGTELSDRYLHEYGMYDRVVNGNNTFRCQVQSKGKNWHCFNALELSALAFSSYKNDIEVFGADIDGYDYNGVKASDEEYILVCYANYNSVNILTEDYLKVCNPNISTKLTLSYHRGGTDLKYISYLNRIPYKCSTIYNSTLVYIPIKGCNFSTTDLVSGDIVRLTNIDNTDVNYMNYNNLTILKVIAVPSVNGPLNWHHNESIGGVYGLLNSGVATWIDGINQGVLTVNAETVGYSMYLIQKNYRNIIREGESNWRKLHCCIFPSDSTSLTIYSCPHSKSLWSDAIESTAIIDSTSLVDINDNQLSFSDYFMQHVDNATIAYLKLIGLYFQNDFSTVNKYLGTDSKPKISISGMFNQVSSYQYYDFFINGNFRNAQNLTPFSYSLRPSRYNPIDNTIIDNNYSLNKYDNLKTDYNFDYIPIAQTRAVYIP